MYRYSCDIVLSWLNLLHRLANFLQPATEMVIKIKTLESLIEIYMVNTAKSCPVTIDRTCKHTKTHYLGILLTNGNLAIWSSLGASTDNYMKVWQWKFLTVFHWSSYLHWSRSLMMPPENIRKPLVFWCFQEVSKEISGMKWVG